MKHTKYVFTALAAITLASQLVGCSAVTSEQAANMIGDTTTVIEIDVPELDTDSSLGGGGRVNADAQPWTPLGDLTNYPEMRSVLNEYTKKDDTLLTAMENDEFVKALESNYQTFAPKLNYTDVDDSNSYEAVVDAYFNLTPSPSTTFNGDVSLTRGEAMALVTRATQTPESNGSHAEETFSPDRNKFMQALSDQPNADQASYQIGNAYVQMYDGLDESTYNAPMTRIEFIYLVVNATSLKQSQESESVTFDNIKPDASSDVFGIDAIKKFAEDPASGVPQRLYDSLVTAYSYDEGHSIITTKLDYESAISKKEAIAIIETISRGRGEGIDTKSADENRLKTLADLSYKSHYDVLTCDHNTYVDEFVQLMKDGSTQADAEQQLLQKYGNGTPTQQETTQPTEATTTTNAADGANGLSGDQGPTTERPAETTVAVTTQKPVQTTVATTKPPVQTTVATNPPAPVVTQPPVTQPPATQPVHTQPPQTQPPQTQPVVTQPPQTEPPQTQPPVVETQPVYTQPPQTEPPQNPTEYDPWSDSSGDGPVDPNIGGDISWGGSH